MSDHPTPGREVVEIGNTIMTLGTDASGAVNDLELILKTTCRKQLNEEGIEEEEIPTHKGGG
jgi:hypothetical protein